MKKLFLFIPLVLSACSLSIGSKESSETLPPLTTLSQSDNSSSDSDDLYIDDREYDYFWTVMSDLGYTNIIDQYAAQSIGQKICGYAYASSTQEEFIDRLLVYTEQIDGDPTTVGEVSGALGGVMCASEFNRLGITS